MAKTAKLKNLIDALQGALKDGGVNVEVEFRSEGRWVDKGAILAIKSIWSNGQNVFIEAKTEE